MPGAGQGEKKEELVLDISGEIEKEEVKEEVKPITLQGIFDDLNNYLIESSGVDVNEKLLFFQFLGSMIRAGMPITDCLELLGKEEKNAKFQRVIFDMKNSIEGGSSLAIAMESNNDVFDSATCAVVEAGEKSGNLSEILRELVSQFERLKRIKEKVKAVMTYPVVVFVVMILLTIVVVIFVVPKLEELFGGSENLPLPTRILLTMSDIVLNHWILLVLVLGSIVAIFITWQRSAEGRRQLGSFLLSIPIVNDVLREMILIRISKIFGFLIGAGVPIMDSLKIAAQIADNQAYKEKLLLAADDLSKGIMIAENISDDPKLFPAMMVNMVSIGEKTASLDKTMMRVAEFYDDSLNRRIKTLGDIMDPIILGFIAVGAVFMILAIYLPILKMNEQIMG